MVILLHVKFLKMVQNWLPYTVIEAFSYGIYQIPRKLQNTGKHMNNIIYMKFRSFLAHSTCIWDIDILPQYQGAPVPAGTFVTCSADNTIRFWNLDQNVESQLDLRASIAQQNIFCRELLHLIHIPTGKSKMCYILMFSEKGGVRCVKFSHDGKYVACGDKEGYVR